MALKTIMKTTQKIKNVNITRGLAANIKNINNKTVTNKCPICKGTKQFVTGSIESSNIKNLNIQGSLQIVDDCRHCKGTGEISHVIRVIKGNRKRLLRIEGKRVS